MGEVLKKATYHNWSFWICLITSIILIAVSFVVPPTGIIDGSVLCVTGELFAFAALGSLIDAIHKGKDATLTHNNTTITIGDTVQTDKEILNEEENYESEETA